MRSKPTGGPKGLTEEMAYLHEKRSVATFVAYHVVHPNKVYLITDAFDLQRWLSSDETVPKSLLIMIVILDDQHTILINLN